MKIAPVGAIFARIVERPTIGSQGDRVEDAKKPSKIMRLRVGRTERPPASENALAGRDSFLRRRIPNLRGR